MARCLTIARKVTERIYTTACDHPFVIRPLSDLLTILKAGDNAYVRMVDRADTPSKRLISTGLT
jgi:hypothetical protein